MFRSISNLLSRSEFATWQLYDFIYCWFPPLPLQNTKLVTCFFGQSCFFLKACSFLPFVKNVILIKFICITVLTFVFFHVFIGSTSTVHYSFLCIMFFFTAKCNIVYSKYPVSLSHWQGIQFVPLLTLVFYHTYTFTGMYIYIDLQWIQICCRCTLWQNNTAMESHHCQWLNQQT